MLTIQVCIGSACHVKGSYSIINKLQMLVDENEVGDKVTIKTAFCLGECKNAVSVKLDEKEIFSVSEDNLEGFFKTHVLDRLKKHA